MHIPSTTTTAPRRLMKLPLLGAVLVLALALLSVASVSWAGAQARSLVHGPPARMAAAQGVVPQFEVSVAEEGVAGGGLRVRDIVVLSTRRGESVTGSCRGCHGGHVLGPVVARGSEVILKPRNLVVTGRSRLLVSVTATGMAGRFKEYSGLNTRVGHRKLVDQGCIAPSGAAHVSCSLAAQTELGVASTSGAAVPSCPGAPCLAVSRTTGFQVSGDASGVSAPHGGSINAWTIRLGKPAFNQIAFFDASYGGVAEAGIAILRPQLGLESTFRLVALSPIVKLERYFGSTHRILLKSALPVDAGDVVALNVPTWAPALAPGLGNETTWRSSRHAGQCTDTSTPTAQLAVGGSSQYGCLYGTARLTYSATFSSIP